MSVNLRLIADVYEKDKAEDPILPRIATLSGFSRGITHSAWVTHDDEIEFPGGVIATVSDVRHVWQPSGSMQAPISTVLAEVSEAISREQWEELLAVGFQEPVRA